MLTQNTVLFLLGSSFIVIAVVAIFLRSRGDALGSYKKISFNQGLVFIVGFLLIMIFTIYHRGNG